MHTWEVTFITEKSDTSIYGEAEKGATPGTLRVVFDSKDAKGITPKPIKGGVSVKFFGVLRVKSIPGGLDNGSYEIPPISPPPPPIKSKA